MTRDVYAVAADTSLETAARWLATRHVSGAPVINSAGRPVGVVSLSDLADPDRPRSESNGYPRYYRLGNGGPQEIGTAFGADYGADFETGTGCVADVMSPFVLSISAHSTVVDAAKVMIADEVHRLLVLDAERLVGIVSVTDLLRGFVDSNREGDA